MTPVAVSEQSRRVLVVEDDIIIGLDLRKILDLEGAVARRYSQVDVLAPGAQCLRCRVP